MGRSDRLKVPRRLLKINFLEMIKILHAPFPSSHLNHQGYALANYVLNSNANAPEDKEHKSLKLNILDVSRVKWANLYPEIFLPINSETKRVKTLKATIITLLCDTWRSCEGTVAAGGYISLDCSSPSLPPPPCTAFTSELRWPASTNLDLIFFFFFWVKLKMWTFTLNAECVVRWVQLSPPGFLKKYVGSKWPLTGSKTIATCTCTTKSTC